MEEKWLLTGRRYRGDMAFRVVSVDGLERWRYERIPYCTQLALFVVDIVSNRFRRHCFARGVVGRSYNFGEPACVFAPFGWSVAFCCCRGGVAECQSTATLRQEGCAGHPSWYGRELLCWLGHAAYGFVRERRRVCSAGSGAHRGLPEHFITSGRHDKLCGRTVRTQSKREGGAKRRFLRQGEVCVTGWRNKPAFAVTHKRALLTCGVSEDHASIDCFEEALLRAKSETPLWTEWSFAPRREMA